MITDIREYLRTLPVSEPLYFYPNPGNAGDSLLAHVTFQMLREIGIPYQLLSHKTFDSRGKIVVYGGGGNLVGYYHHGKNFVEKHYDRAKRLIILPHTIMGNEDLLARFTANVDIIAREETTYNHVRKSARRANVFLAHDLAFHLDAQKMASETPPLSVHLMNLRLPVRLLLQGHSAEVMRILRRLMEGAPGNLLNCFRTDQERSGAGLPANNVDVSSVFAYGTESEQRAFYATYRLVHFINHYEEIRTNRLHGAIVGALLGKQVKLYPNNYFKCEAVYKFSIEGKFPNVQWMG